MNRRPPAAGSDTGSIAPAVLLLGMMFLVLAGLVVDSGRLFNARARATAYAEEAARAGAQAVDPVSSPLRLLPERVVAARVNDYCAEVRRTEPRAYCRFVGVAADHVLTCGSIDIQPSLLGLVGVQTLHGLGTAQAVPVLGVGETNIDAGPPVPMPGVGGCGP